MKLTGILAEQGLHAFDAPHRHQGHEVPRIWIVVADRENAHIYRKTAEGIEPIGTALPGHSQAHAEDTDHYQKKIQSPGTGSAGPRHDPANEKLHHDDMAFVRGFMAWLDEAEKKTAFDRIVLVAAHRTLGDMRSCMTKNVHARIVAEISKEFTKLPGKEIEEHLKNIVWF